MKNKMMKILTVCALTVGCIGLSACGFAGGGESSQKNIEGDLIEVMDNIFENANVDADFKEAYSYYNKDVITEKEFLLGTNDIEFAEGVYAVPAMSSVAFQAVLLRLNDDQDPDEIETLLEEKADPRKWVCVEPETIDAENVGNVVFFIMGDEKNTEALMEAFQSYE